MELGHRTWRQNFGHMDGLFSAGLEATTGKHKDAQSHIQTHSLSNSLTHSVTLKKQWEKAERSRGRQNHFVVADPRRTKACVGDKSLRQNGTDRGK